MSAATRSNDSVIYGVDDKLPIVPALILAAQHVLTMFGATIAVPLMRGPEGKLVPYRLA